MLGAEYEGSENILSYRLVKSDLFKRIFLEVQVTNLCPTLCKYIYCVHSSYQIQLSGIASIIFGITRSEDKNVLPQAELPLICLEFEGQVP